jgi:hypothetical protein
LAVLVHDSILNRRSALAAPVGPVVKKTQRHPVFAELLRPLVESHYQLETNMPVGDALRQADFALLRRTRPGPTVSPRDDLDLLAELGLGIHRRLNEERAKQRQRARRPEATGLWYLANRLGRRLLRGWERRLPGLRPHGAGVWRWQVLDHPVFLVSSTELPVEEASLPLLLLDRATAELEQAVARLVAGSSALWERSGGWLASLHPAMYKEVQTMAKQRRGALRLDLSPIVESMGMDWVIDHLGPERVIEHLGAKRLVKQLGAQQLVEQLGGVKSLLAKLSAEQRQELKQLLQE